jgi:subtilisin family serine protease
MPVSLVLKDPALSADDLPRNPVVAVLDTTIAEHPWFTDPKRVVRLGVSDGQLVPNEQAVAPTPLNLLTGERSRLEGHGTFIAGLIRQGCPEAIILSIPVMNDEGVAEEGDVLDALTALLARHLEGQASGRPEDCIDVLSLSLGYYAEDRTYKHGPVQRVLARFAEHGVLVVAGVGNDACELPFVPAALAEALPAANTTDARPPVASVGAHNPDGQSIALFSNALEHVTAHRAGVSVVSTVPLVDGAGQSSVSTPGTGAGTRRSIDPDDYRGGFAAWSGTSFATPVLAAELAAELAGMGQELTDVSDAAMQARSLKALRACLERKQP